MNDIKKKLKQLRTVVGNRGMQFMISVSFTLVSVLGMVFVGIFLYRNYGEAAEKVVTNDSQKIINQVEINVNSYLRNMMRVSDAMYYHVIKNKDFSQESIDQELKLLYEANKDNLVNVSCFNLDGELIGSAPFTNRKEDVDITGQSWFTHAAEQMENLHFSELHIQDIFETGSNKPCWVVSLSRGVELINNGKMTEGILLVDLDFSGIRRLFTRINNDETGYVYLIDGDGKIIYHPLHNLIFSNKLKENNYVASRYEDGAYKERFQGKNRMVVVKTVGYTGWKIVSVTPIKQFYQDFSRVKIMATVIIIIAIIIMIFANRFLAVRVVQPLKKLEDSLKWIGVDEEPQIYIGGSQEIQHLGETIASMVDQLRQLTDDIVREQEEKRKSELDALQSQINPHFLYNTLDSIMWMIEAEQYEDAIAMVSSLGRLLRISISKGKNIITIGEELEHARSYLDIQKYRYKNKFTSYFEVEEGIEKYKTIKLIIQPLIENAIYYGMEYMDGDGEIHIRAYSNETEIFIEVEDNGLGIPQEQLENLLTDQTRSRSRGSGIGIQNVHQRIQLYFGKKYGLEIISEPDEGTMVRIHLPKTEEFDMGEKDNRK